MAKWGFDENVSRVKPHLKGAVSPRGPLPSPQEPTEPPPARPGEPEALPPAETAVEHRRRSVVRDLMHVSDEVAAAEAAAAATVAQADAPENVTVPSAFLKMPAAPEPLAPPAEEIPAGERAPEKKAVARSRPPREPLPEPAAHRVTGSAAAPDVEAAAVEVGAEPPPEPDRGAWKDPLAAIDPAGEDRAPLKPLDEPMVTSPPPTPAAVSPATRRSEPASSAPEPVPPAGESTMEALLESDGALGATHAVPRDEDAAARRADIKRRAAGLAQVAPPAPVGELPDLDDFSDIEAAAQLAADLERALEEAAEANESLRRDLAAALDDLARSTAEGKRLREKLGRSEADAQERSRVVQDLVREMELLEGERDGALLQAADAALSTDEVNERLLASERRVQGLERALADSNARTQRFEEAARTQAAQRAALRTELESVRRERDALVGRNAELEREREALSRSRQALDEVHRALSEARARAQRIRSR